MDEARTRRQVLGSVAVAGAGVVGLGACGAQGGKGSTASGETVPAGEVPVGGGKLMGDINTVVTQPKEGTFKAFSAVCTHQGCTVGGVRNNVISCPCHGSEFSAADGSVRKGPASEPLAGVKVTVEGQNLRLG